MYLKALEKQKAKLKTNKLKENKNRVEINKIQMKIIKRINEVLVIEKINKINKQAIS